MRKQAEWLHAHLELHGRKLPHNQAVVGCRIGHFVEHRMHALLAEVVPIQALC